MAILDNLEAEQSMRNKNETISYINQPEKIAISSNNGEQAQVAYNGQYQNAYYNFTIDLPRAVLGVKSIELLSANIPQCQVNLPDDSLVFFYYRLLTKRNDTDTETLLFDPPNINNLYYVRLLPSYYKKDLIPNASNYGFNRTFTSYADLATELVKACNTDLAYVNAGNSSQHFTPNDISLTFNESLNRFQMVCNNTQNALIPVYNFSLTYQQNDIVEYSPTESVQNINYISKQNNNIVNPSLIIYTWTSTQQFYGYNIALYNGVYYTSKTTNINVTPTVGADWALSTYSSITSYNIGFNCLYNGLWYVSLVSGSIGHTPDIATTYWRYQPYTSGGGVGFYFTAYPWTTNIYYYTNNVILYNDVYYKALTSHQDIPPTGNALSPTTWAVIAFNSIYNTFSPVPWYSITVSVAFNIVYSPVDGNNYVCVAGNTGIDPSDRSYGTTYWISYYWSSSINYSTKSPQGGVANFPIYYNGIWYSSTSLTGNLNKRPDLYPTYWKTGPTSGGVMDWWALYTTPLTSTYLAAGYEDPNVWTLTQSLKTVFDGLDFNMNTFVAPATAQLYSIPSAPIQRYQTLNLRLGFTWNGLYNWSVYTRIAGNADIFSNGNIYALLFNRLRPVPPYEVDFGLGAPSLSYGAIPSSGNPYTAITYTADGFANLVYSSIINIYTNIIGPSTTDTERNVNLLDTVPLNCGNLGITFYNPVISNKLTKIPNDIYTIYFEFRKEDGTEYYFSNNAIITLTLGLTYK